MRERRSSKRWNAALKARMVFNNRCSVLDCTVRNLLNAGAGISFTQISPMPTEFELDIPNRGFRVRGRLMWSQGTHHGVMFWQKAKAWTVPARSQEDGCVIPLKRRIDPER